MNRTYEDMSKEELVTLVKRLTKQHDEWSAEATQLREAILLAEVKRLRLVEMSVQDFLDENIDSLEFCRNMRDMGVIE